MKRSGMVVDINNGNMFPATVSVHDGVIAEIKRDQRPLDDVYIIPGFIDAHIHIESSLIVPSEFARLASCHGTVATVSDPHEIANVLGMAGVRFMLENSRKIPFHFFFGAPSCVPATAFETAGADISAQDIAELFDKDGLLYLSEMMNYPGVINRNTSVLEKIHVARQRGKPIDGHAPGVRGDEATAYIQAGITTDHECYLLDEALEKIQKGMKIIIREGSAAKNYDALHPLLKLYPDKVMFCSDDKHPHELIKGHINELVRRSVSEKQYNLMDVLRAACLNPIKHYGLPVGCLQIGQSADFIIVKDLADFSVIETIVKGVPIARQKKPLFDSVPVAHPNAFYCQKKKSADFRFLSSTAHSMRVIKVTDGQLVTEKAIQRVDLQGDIGEFRPDIDRDILKLAVINRYEEASPVALAAVQNFGLLRGAIASSVAHDSHNIIVVGTNDIDMCAAANAIIDAKGGISLADGENVALLRLPIAGLMSDGDGFHVAREYNQLQQLAAGLGSHLHDPFMTLSFMALLVIPELKLSDKGLFDGRSFSFVDPFVAE